MTQAAGPARPGRRMRRDERGGRRGGRVVAHRQVAVGGALLKTRSLAAQAVSGGLVRVADQRIKASRRVRRGEIVHVRRGVQEWDVVVKGLRDERRPAPQAQALYEETPASIERRTSERARREQAEMRRARAQGRPTRRERRALARWRERREDSAGG